MGCLMADVELSMDLFRYRCRVADGLVSLPMSSCRWTCFVTDVELSMDLFRYRCRVIDGLSCCRCQVVDGLVSLPMSSCRWTCFVTDVVELLIESLRIYLCLCTVREIDAWNTRNSGHSCRSSVCLATLYTLDRCRMCVYLCCVHAAAAAASGDINNSDLTSFF